MPFIRYSNGERQAAARIWMEEGGTAAAMVKAIQRIRDELGINLPEQSKSLRSWAKRFKYVPRRPTVPALFVEEPRQAEIVSRLLTPEQLQERLQEYAGSELADDAKLLAEVRREIKSDRIRESLRGKTIEELLTLRRIIEDGQQKRERHLVAMSEYVDLRKRRAKAEAIVDDDEILTELEDSHAVEN